MVQILVHTHFDLVSWLLALEGAEPVTEMVNQMAVEPINVHLSSVQQKRWVKKIHSFHLKPTTNKFWSDAEMMLKS